jgi:hypothetical protein
LLSDTDSRIIKAFGILNDTVKPGTTFYGIPFPGTYVLDTTGKVVAKYFEDDYRERTSASDILTQQYGTPAEGARSTTETKHLRIVATASHAED